MKSGKIQIARLPFWRQALLEMHSKVQHAVNKVQVSRVWYHGQVRREDPVYERKYGSAFLRNDDPQVRAISDHLGGNLSVTEVLRH